MDTREWIIAILFCALVAIGAWQNGYIYRDLRSDKLREDVIKSERKITDHEGRIIVLEGKKK